MQLKELACFDQYFGEKVDYDFLNDDSPLVLSQQEEDNLKEGAVLRAVQSGERIEIGTVISGGGEGMIYSLVDNSSYVAKIYKPTYRTRLKAEKLKKLVSFKNENARICWPCDVLETDSGVFVGFIMPFVKGKNMQSLTSSPKRMEKFYPEVDRRLQIEIILEILQLFRYLHEHNILFGDVNLQNIMFDSEYHVIFVDMDCVQAGEFPCVTSSEGFDSPEVILRGGSNRFDRVDGVYAFNRYYRNFYRNPEMECFSISVLIYKLLMNGFVPYDYRDFGFFGGPGEYNDNKLCMKQKFAYSTDRDKVEEQANCKKIWSHFPSFLKEAFVNCYTYNKRYTDDEWIKLFTKYKYLLESGELAKVDPECMNIFPDNEISYDTVRFALNETVVSRGFSACKAMEKILDEICEVRLKRSLPKIAKALKDKPECVVCITNKGNIYIDEQPNIGEIVIASYRFCLAYNIGVLKKIKCEYVL